MVQRLLALPLLPAQHITAAFYQLKTTASDNTRLDEVFTYVQDQWIDNSSWKPEDWSVYGKPVRTNIDCEGWHRRLNYRTVSRPPFYVLVKLLHREATYVQTQVKLVSAKKMKKLQRKAQRQTEGKIFEVWGSYSRGEMSVEALLKKLAKVYRK